MNFPTDDPSGVTHHHTMTKKIEPSPVEKLESALADLHVQEHKTREIIAQHEQAEVDVAESSKRFDDDAAVAVAEAQSRVLLGRGRRAVVEKDLRAAEQRVIGAVAEALGSPLTSSVDEIKLPPFLHALLRLEHEARSKVKPVPFGLMASEIFMDGLHRTADRGKLASFPGGPGGRAEERAEYLRNVQRTFDGYFARLKEEFAAHGN